MKVTVYTTIEATADITTEQIRAYLDKNGWNRIAEYPGSTMHGKSSSKIQITIIDDYDGWDFGSCVVRIANDEGRSPCVVLKEISAGVRQ
jgi:hypothetical protein